MKEIIVSNDCSTPEGFHNSQCQLSPELRKKEYDIAHLLLGIAMTDKLPDSIEYEDKLPPTELRLAKRAIKEYKADEEEVKVVCRKVVYLLAQGFHVYIINHMLRCAIVGEKDITYGDYFAQKFGAAKDKIVRKNFWGVEESAPLEAVRGLVDELFARTLDRINGYSVYC